MAVGAIGQADGIVVVTCGGKAIGVVSGSVDSGVGGGIAIVVAAAVGHCDSIDGVQLGGID